MEDVKKFLWIIFFIVLTIVVITNIKEMAIQLIVARNEVNRLVLHIKCLILIKGLY
nr:hypothetical protein [Campylobacter fetus]